jgi:hypothetical protein
MQSNQLILSGNTINMLALPLLFCTLIERFFIIMRSKLLLVWLLLAFVQGIELETVRQVLRTTFGRNSTDLSFGMEEWMAQLTPITHNLDLHSNEIYRSFTEYDLNFDGRVNLGEILTRMNFIPKVRIGPKQLHIGLTGRDQ